MPVLQSCQVQTLTAIRAKYLSSTPQKLGMLAMPGIILPDNVEGLGFSAELPFTNMEIVSLVRNL